MTMDVHVKNVSSYNSPVTKFTQTFYLWEKC